MMKTYLKPELKIGFYYANRFIMASGDPWQDDLDDGRDDIF